MPEVVTVNDPTLRAAQAAHLLRQAGASDGVVAGWSPARLRLAALKAASPVLRLGLRLLAGDTVFVTALEAPESVRAALGLPGDSGATLTYQGDAVAARGR